MGVQNTSNQGLPYPDDNEAVKDVPDHIRVLAQAVERQLVQSFASTSDRSTRLTSVAEGMLCWLRDVNRLYVYTGSTWAQIYPATPSVSSGTAVPTASADVGSIYVRY